MSVATVTNTVISSKSEESTVLPLTASSQNKALEKKPARSCLKRPGNAHNTEERPTKRLRYTASTDGEPSDWERSNRVIAQRPKYNSPASPGKQLRQQQVIGYWKRLGKEEEAAAKARAQRRAAMRPSRAPVVKLLTAYVKERQPMY